MGLMSTTVTSGCSSRSGALPEFHAGMQCVPVEQVQRAEQRSAYAMLCAIAKKLGCCVACLLQELAPATPCLFPCPGCSGAASLPAADIAAVLIEAGAEVNATDDRDVSALICAAAEGCTAAVQLLLREWAATLVVGWCGCEAVVQRLTQAAWSSLRAAHVAHSRRPDIECCGCAALTLAPAHPSLHAGHGADVKQRDCNGWTALHHCCRWGQLPVQGSACN